MSDFNLSTHPESFTAHEIGNVYNAVNFTIRSSMLNDPNFHKKIYPAGVHGLFVTHDGELIAAARLMSDLYITTWIAELCVHPNWQNKGVGSLMMTSILEKFGHMALYLEALTGTETFFEKFGIKPRQTIVGCSRAPQQ